MEKWTVNTGRMTTTFYDKRGTEMLVEQINWFDSEFRHGLLAREREATRSLKRQN